MFNCGQRAHANVLETVPMVLPSLLGAGLRHPLLASGLGIAWALCRVAYFRGYTDPDQSRNRNGTGRLRGLGGQHWWPMFGLMGLCAWTGVTMLWEDGSVAG